MQAELRWFQFKPERCSNKLQKAEYIDFHQRCINIYLVIVLIHPTSVNRALQRKFICVAKFGELS